jgi:hypothetical protein
MKSLKEMKAAMTASEMNLVKGGAEEVLMSDIDPTLIDEALWGNVNTISAECTSKGAPKSNCTTFKGFLSWYKNELICAPVGPLF